ncbi:Clr6 histone deacetylase associated PHD protein-2 Cph2 [Friedmanniomyces endolithicus]|uniref:Clr6 histone deacetylase associated PHD protein-2 Cph2 n=1 Tax=Friedmanniomyces endolithicus TaxID=329885 RepID=A0AAN6JFE4_9PEZI|nr:Clr6 histone deacetylase associated PHD protein-2 Cph2 [Friedmanniomyces endolithicus]KAK0328142.1 Clr6 histone deacetylase associated PHD protein-2 Cph2 [Friedmanniomyces endolithicus]KAK0979209.1 Clr6 histone deacetylase associated PHD protein-2 Cph2 [Friedmanniomyces endolithicus]KAK0981786.1 Clr6 histone deacetylase associated PHD protein-2 Cph2 [Friedmanniomyces endolithicus]KAK1009553.1 Clr6 histone deacetylase associated PHD protein-2 Cph2 [Friedmanniomyces endolithicus]
MPPPFTLRYNVPPSLSQTPITHTLGGYDVVEAITLDIAGLPQYARDESEHRGQRDMDSNMPWPGGFGSGTTTFGQHATSGQEGEDWEDWLRWDPAADPTSPDTGTFHSGSSKNDSPLQDPAIPVLPGSDLFGKRSGDDGLAPPLIVDEDALDFGMNSMLSNEPFLFGLSNNVASGFDSNAQAYLPLQQEMPRIDTNWTLPSNVQPEEVTLSALSNEHARFPFNALPPDNIPDLHRSTGSSSQQRTSSSGNSDSNSPPHSAPKKRAGRKRKAEIEQEKAAENGESVDGDEPPVKKTSHNVIEKRYRNNLNDKIVELRNAVPALRAMGRADNGGDEEDLEGLTPAHKLNKATVMGKATEYIKHLEKRNKTIADEMEALQARLDAVEAAIGTSRDRQSSGASQKSASGSLYASQDAPRYPGQSGVQQQQQYTQSQQQPNYAPQPRPAVDAQNQQGQYVYGRNRGGVVGKVMMGAMASIMIMEGFSGGQQDDDDTRQLFAVPTTLLKRGLVESASSSPATLARHATLPLLKLMCIIGAFLYLIIPLLHFSTPRKHHKKRHAIRLPQVPSLASPVEVRRKAWLTALQTVYVPKHFLLEVAAVTAKMVSLSLRRLIGSDTWNAITGTNKEEAAARCKAWDIAIDAQLAGGDAEVSYHRLLLTLMASGTLPDSPVRLMQKAVHFRVFFWELSNAGYGNMVGFKALTEKVGRIYWDSARKLQKELTQTQHQYGGHRREDEEVELLPDHLAHLVDLDCDDVLNDEMIQRGWNLAWNKPSAFHTTPNTPRDSVVEDHAIRSPLDAVAAWYANMIIDDTLLNAMGEHPSSLDTEYYLNLAIGITPPASATQVRALAAKAVLLSTRRDANIIAALEALPPASTTASSMNLVNHAPAAPDVRTALTLAKLLSLLSPNSSSTCAPSTAQSREKAFDRLAALHIPAPNLTLLTAVACYHLLRLTTQERLALPSRAARGLEDTAANLRLWIGTLAGRRAGLEGGECGRVVDLCLGVMGKVGGWVGEADSGYGSGCGSGDVSPVR